MRFFLIKAERHSARLALVCKRQGYFVAVFPIVQMHDVVRFDVKSADFFERVFNARFLDCKLALGCDVLKIATAATPEIRASRFHSVG